MTRTLLARAVEAEHTYRTVYVPSGVGPAAWWLYCDCDGLSVSAGRDGYAELTAAHYEHVRAAVRVALDAAGVTVR